MQLLPRQVMPQLDSQVVVHFSDGLGAGASALASITIGPSAAALPPGQSGPTGKHTRSGRLDWAACNWRLGQHGLTRTERTKKHKNYPAYDMT